MNAEIAEAFSLLTKEKSIDKDQLTEIVHNTVIAMIKKKYGAADNFDVYINLDKGEIEIHQTKTIVEQVTDEVLEIDLESARKIEPDLEIGDEFLEIVNPISFGRRIITSAKQNLNQRIRDEEKRVISDEFENRIGEIVMGDVRQVSRGDIYLNVDRSEVLLPRKEQIDSERYRRGDNIRAIVKEVRRTSRGPEIIVSRSDPQFLVRLFELEVPEIYDGIIEVKAVVRQPGERAKIAVVSNDKRIDAVGACVGMKGIRIQAVSRELNNEKVDVIPWSSEKEVFITRALSPAKPIRVLVDRANNRAIAVLPDEQVSLGIGRGGQNRRLTGRLTGFEIEIVKESEYRKMVEAQRSKELPLDTIDGISDTLLGKLRDAEIHTRRDVLAMGEEGLKEVKGIGEKTAAKILELVEAADKKSGDRKDDEDAPEEQEVGSVSDEANAPAPVSTLDSDNEADVHENDEPLHREGDAADEPSLQVEAEVEETADALESLHEEPQIVDEQEQVANTESEERL